ncbi:MAG: hypothetical protein AB7T06_24180 [Kofleriaceae bacterium]
MSIAVVGDNASYEFRWRRWAMLRDVVKAHLDRDGHRFVHFVSIERALWSPLRIVAKRLGEEVGEMRRLLADRPIDLLVLGPETAAVIYPGAVLAEPRPLTTKELTSVAPIAEPTLGGYFASMIDSIEDVCKHPFSDACVEVIDG